MSDARAAERLSSQPLGSVPHVAVIRLIRVVATTLSLYLGTHLFVFAVLPVAIIVSYLDPKTIPPLRQWFVRSLFAMVGKRLRISGQHYVDPARRYVIVSNYPSGYAGFALLGQFPRASLVAHAFLRRIPLLSHALRRIGAIFVQPGRAALGKKAIDLYLDAVDVIPSLIILPEGGRTRDGTIHRFRRGFVHIQRQTSFDILPVTLNGLYHLKPVGRLYADPDADPHMIIHPPMASSVANNMSDETLIAAVRDTIASVYRP
jgi:1-acyl-sn-glycerol-3-phosphate acyltransferase